MSIKSQKDMLLNNVIMIMVFCILSIISGIVLIYNLLNISIRERNTEFGTMNILGLSYYEIYEIIIFEQLINFIIGIIISLPIAHIIRKLVEIISSSDYFNVNLVLQPTSYMYSFIISLLIIIISLLAILNNLRNIDITAVLKERG